MKSLNNLLEEISLGKEVFAENKDIEQIIEYVDPDYKIFLTSERITSLMEEIDLNDKQTTILEKIVSKFQATEKRILEGKELTSIYKKMTIENIVESINYFIKTSEPNKKVLAELDKSVYSKILGSASFGVNELKEGCEYFTRTIKFDSVMVKQLTEAEVIKITTLLEDDLAEMSLPSYKDPTKAVADIENAYRMAVVKKQPAGDYLGPLTNAVKYLSGLTNPEKYTRTLKKGMAAQKAIAAYRATKSKTQAVSTVGYKG